MTTEHEGGDEVILDWAEHEAMEAVCEAYPNLRFAIKRLLRMDIISNRGDDAGVFRRRKKEILDMLDHLDELRGK